MEKGAGDCAFFISAICFKRKGKLDMNQQANAPSTNEDVFKYYTQKAGDINRQFGLAALGLIWIFHGIQAPAGYQLLLPLTSYLKFSLVFIALSLSTDLFQYMFGSWMWKREFKREPLGAASTSEVTIRISLILITAKLLLMSAAYLMILCFVLNTGFI